VLDENLEQNDESLCNFDAPSTYSYYLPVY